MQSVIVFIGHWNVNYFSKLVTLHKFSKWSKFKRIESDIRFMVVANRQKAMWLVADTQH